MALPVVTPSEVPQHTTLSRFVLNRLESPSLDLVFSETLDAWQDVNIVRAVDTDSDGLFEVAVLAPLGTLPLGGNLVGRELLSLTGVRLGAIVSVAFVDAPPVAGMAGAMQELHATLDTPLSSPAGQMARLPFFNAFGARAHVMAKGGKNYTLSLLSTDPASQSRLQQALIAIHVAAVLPVLAALGLPRTQEDVTQAIVGLAGSGVNLESIIASGLEAIELDRRSGAFRPTVVVGTP